MDSDSENLIHWMNIIITATAYQKQRDCRNRFFVYPLFYVTHNFSKGEIGTNKSSVDEVRPSNHTSVVYQATSLFVPTSFIVLELDVNQLICSFFQGIPDKLNY